MTITLPGRWFAVAGLTMAIAAWPAFVWPEPTLLAVLPIHIINCVINLEWS
jgi:hypothetical protein